ncbi:DUF2000 domain-containing protein [Micropruina sp.]|uniref:DUF2000 domain-containing protein n=1 Tax=Micropruina sp. TaxID=2737536 RepID=UPI0039E2C297
MNDARQKTVIVVDQRLPAGLAVNAASIVAAMMTTAMPDLMGPAVATADAELPGVVLAPLPVLASDGEALQSIWDRADAPGSGLIVFPFTRLAQGCKTYEEYTEKVALAATHELELAALGLAGPRKTVTSLTGDMSLYPAKEK